MKARRKEPIRQNDKVELECMISYKDAKRNHVVIMHKDEQDPNVTERDIEDLIDTLRKSMLRALKNGLFIEVTE